MDMKVFQSNRQRFPAEELARYAGQFVAWSADGTRILASDRDELRLVNALPEAGLSSAETLIAFVPAEDEILLGGGVEAND
jgi:hypothetical protein